MKLRITILKYHSWYLRQISLQVMLLSIQIKWRKCLEGRLNVSVEPRATFTSARGFSYIASILFTQVKITRQSTLSRQDRTVLDQRNPYNPLEQSYSDLSKLI